MLLPRIDKRIDDLQYENYNVPTLQHGHRVLVPKDITGGVGSDIYVYTENDYVDGRVEKTFAESTVTFRTIDDAKQVTQLAKLNALLKQLVNGKTATTAKLKIVLTQEQYKEYLYKLENEQDVNELKYGNGVPEELRKYNRMLKAADFQNTNYENMSALHRSGQAKYKYDTVSKAYNKAESLYESALERLGEIWSVSTPTELYELQNWMDREIDFDLGSDRTIGICVDTIPRVRGSRSSRALDSGLPKLSTRLKRQECQLIALREAACNIAFESKQDVYEKTPAMSQKLKSMMESMRRITERD
ncbi:MAG: hypothetical protein EBT78_16310 [Betaproteobacteria bacterium]|nr:hypothetical protein [Betaproteobacteria bacterium]NBT69312.1 hypothetical protein [Betaproteobacteria bacterium]